MLLYMTFCCLPCGECMSSLYFTLVFQTFSAFHYYSLLFGVITKWVKLNMSDPSLSNSMMIRLLLCLWSFHLYIFSIFAYFIWPTGFFCMADWLWKLYPLCCLRESHIGFDLSAGKYWQCNVCTRQSVFIGFLLSCLLLCFIWHKDNML